ncbi:ABC transporter ATP-binding protein [Novibacillus thermophilus]|uniref:Multidrug ABC transporter ATP-binding protein n=1 Tax=Novibacillus thermophilus TaxID=1471761 RepID=A0A1U9K829_9BACL|nr:ABC transporter ATP-binding protein [Novibacillus thermophilus]AQS56156.1 multidrug ABC transporter ATP-binding protein [Novibacillus thermophilus]
MDTHLLEVSELTGGYDVRRPVIRDVSFYVDKREIVGLIGMNGAGKSTTIKHILGLMQPTSGLITLNGKTIDEDQAGFRSQVAYIPETPQLYAELTLFEHLELTAMAYQLDEQTFRTRAEELLEEFNMQKMAKWFPSTFSKGMQQKVMIMCALLVRPALLIVDEPFVGLDPLATRSLLTLFEQLKQQGTGILMSTHILGTAERYSDHFVLLHEGRVRLKGTLAQMRDQAGIPDGSLEDLFIEMAKEHPA